MFGAVLSGPVLIVAAIHLADIRGGGKAMSLSEIGTNFAPSQPEGAGRPYSHSGRGFAVSSAMTELISNASGKSIKGRVKASIKGRAAPLIAPTNAEKALPH